MRFWLQIAALLLCVALTSGERILISCTGATSLDNIFPLDAIFWTQCCASAGQVALGCIVADLLWNFSCTGNTFVEEVAPVGAPGGAQEATNPPTPGLYCHDVLVSQPGLVGADMLSLGLALQQQGCTLPNQGSETNKEAENGVKVAREPTGKGFR